jgi:predicted transcriptional regulator
VETNLINDSPTAITSPLVTRIVSSYVRNNRVAPADVAAVIKVVYQSLVALGKDTKPAQLPAVSIRQSVRPSYVVCLECGGRRKMLRKHLREAHGLSPAQYRTKWMLSPDHPITAPAYSDERSSFAKRIGLGRAATRRPSRRLTKKTS